MLPEFYNHPVVAPIQLLQTHISYVLLTGDYAYKVKKATQFGFLDFSTLALRQHFCYEELRLNRRLSPELYLAVLPITQVNQTFYLNDPHHAAVEYTLQMRQFSQEELFSHLFRTGHLTADLLRDLAGQVATFHQQALTNLEIQSYGTSVAMGRVANNNFELSQPYLGRTQTTSQFLETQAFTTHLLKSHTDWVLARLQAKKIRECHGDLHLNNICRYQGQIQIFDCIEFNQDFRNIDVLYDAAFLIMDLIHQGRPDLGNVFLNTYLEDTGDYEGARLLPLYLSMRAYIRGNVNSLALDDPAIAPDQKAKLQQAAIAYYRTAWTFTQQTQGSLYLMSGLSGSGKSTVAKTLAPLINAIHIRSDAVRKHLAGVPLQAPGAKPGTFAGGIYTPEMTQKTYDRLLQLGLSLTQAGWTVILDAKYDQRALRQTAIATAQTHHIPLTILSCLAPVEMIRDRLQHRTGDISDASITLLETQQQQLESFSAQEKSYVIEILTDQDLTDQLQAIVRQSQPELTSINVNQY